MKPLTILPGPLLAGVLFCIASCGGQANNKNSDTATPSETTSTAASKTENIPSSTLVTTPQNMLIMRMKVTDFAKWRMSYEERDSVRLANGVHNYVIGRGLKDSNTVLVALKVDDINKAKSFIKDPGLKQAMQKGGVVGAPVIQLNTLTYQDTGTTNSSLRSRTMFRVKDWEHWQRSFDSSRQTRIDNGITDRAYGHDADDNHKVTVVTAVIDTAKAYAFWKSEQFKQLRAASGAIGEPERFLYRVIKRY